MTESRLEVADVFRQHGQEFLDRWGDVLSQQRKAFQDIVACRTAALGSYVEECDLSMAAKKGAKMAGRKGPVARLPNGFEQL